MLKIALSIVLAYILMLLLALGVAAFIKAGKGEGSDAN